MSVSESLRRLCQQWRCSFVSVSSEIFAQWLTGWRAGAELCTADLTNAVQTRPGIQYAVCVYLCLTACMSQCDPSHQTCQNPLTTLTWMVELHHWSSSSPQGAPGLPVWTGPSGALEQQKLTHAQISQIYHMSLLSLEALFLLTVLRLAWVFDVSETLQLKKTFQKPVEDLKKILSRSFKDVGSFFIMENIKYTAVWHTAFYHGFDFNA